MRRIYDVEDVDEPLESVSIRRKISFLPNINEPSDFDSSHSTHWGINDGNCHNTLPDDHPLRGYPLCMLFHEMYDHWNLGLKDILQLDKVWFDIRLQQSGYFTL